MRCIPLSPLLRFYTEHPAMLRDTAGGEEAYPSHYRFGIIYPLRPCGHLPYILLGKNTPQCCGTRQGRRLECFVLLRRKLQKLRNVLYSSSAHECAIGEVSVRTEGLKTPSYQSVYTGHIPFSPAMSRSITENCVSYIWERIYKNNPH